jgi:hypothetical protein
MDARLHGPGFLANCTSVDRATCSFTANRNIALCLNWQTRSRAPRQLEKLPTALEHVAGRIALELGSDRKHAAIWTLAAGGENDELRVGQLRLGVAPIVGTIVTLLPTPSPAGRTGEAGAMLANAGLVTP